MIINKTKSLARLTPQHCHLLYFPALVLSFEPTRFADPHEINNLSTLFNQVFEAIRKRRTTRRPKGGTNRTQLTVRLDPLFLHFLPNISKGKTFTNSIHKYYFKIHRR